MPHLGPILPLLQYGFAVRLQPTGTPTRIGRDDDRHRGIGGQRAVRGAELKHVSAGYGESRGRNNEVRISKGHRSRPADHGPGDRQGALTGSLQIAQTVYEPDPTDRLYETWDP